MITTEGYCLKIILDKKNGLPLFRKWWAKIRIYECTPPGDDFDYMRPKCTVTFSIDRKYSIAVVNIRFDGWYENSVRLWPKHTEQREQFCYLRELHYRLLVLTLLITVVLILYFSLIKKKEWQSKIYQFIHVRDSHKQHCQF